MLSSQRVNGRIVVACGSDVLECSVTLSANPRFFVGSELKDVPSANGEEHSSTPSRLRDSETPFRVTTGSY